MANFIHNTLMRMFPSRFSTLQSGGAFFNGWDFCRADFASLIWYNICDNIGDLIEDVDMQAGAMSAEGMAMFAQYRAFVYACGRLILQQIWDDGFSVIGYDGIRFRILENNKDYRIAQNQDASKAVALDPNVSVYVIRSTTYIVRGISDKQLCKVWLEYINDILSSSATVTKRLGALVVASPKNLTNAPTQFVMSKEQKKEMEKDFRESYGSLPKQSNLLILPREMAFQTINLAGMDLKATEKLRTAILGIVDRFHLNANQVSIIEGGTSKSLSNGSEIREGDRSKYKAFRRYFEKYFVQMANDLGMTFTYKLIGEPVYDDGKLTETQDQTI